METDKLNPPHRFVPWVVVNNQPLQEDYLNFVDYICRAFSENAKPGAWTSVSARSTYDFSEKNNSLPNLLPWANSHISNTSNSIICQNGSDECQLNSLQTCVLNVWDDVNKHYALISCFEFLAIEARQKSWKICFKQLGLPEKPILDCYNNGNGTELGRKYISKTAQFYPPHNFLPWVLVNNQPIGKLAIHHRRRKMEAS
ncbi:hypothetical protein L6164_002379 [Bauhinia variegata]|uniref:Uncharacterized protein n=1 Tax=Bauhinia variegata TaxID=167791 RepID=A0ACB9PXH2_BAUVA|nr:hypothetical protein L6164_002379 [Bauhinia variegata]